jgi:hypothetical protein
MAASSIARDRAESQPMSDRIRHLTVTLERDMREDDVASIVSAIEHIKGVNSPRFSPRYELRARSVSRYTSTSRHSFARKRSNHERLRRIRWSSLR